MSTPYNQETIDKIEADIRELEQQPLEGPEPLKALAKAYIDLSKEYWKIGTPTALAQAVAAGEKAIHYAKQLPIEVDEYRDVLASAYLGLGLAQWQFGAPTDLQSALASYEQAIQLIKPLPLDNHDYRNNLVIAYRRRGNAYRALGTLADLHQAIESYNQAIELGQELPLDNPEYRNDLAMAYMNRGLAQSDLGTQSDLHEAIESYNQAIELCQALPLDNPEYRNDLIGAYVNRGFAQNHLGTPSDLHQAIDSFNQAIELAQEFHLDNPEYRNELARAYNSCGIAQQLLGTPSNLHEAIESYNQAIKLRQDLPLDNPKYRNALIGAYVNRGVAQQLLGTQSDLQKAIEFYNQAIKLGQDLPLDNFEYRTFFIRGYIARGNAQSDLGTPTDLHEAIESYNQAIKLCQELPLDNPEYRNDLAMVYNQRGNAQSDLGTPSDLHQAIESYNQAIEISQELLSLNNPEYNHSIAGVYCNLGNAQKNLNELKSAIESYNQSLAINQFLDKQVWQYVEFRINTLGGKASACLQNRDFEEANEAAEEGLELLRDLEISGVYVLRSWREWLFDITIETYFAMGPNFITEFLLEHLEPNNKPGAAPESEAMHKAALRALQRLYLMANQGHPEWFLDIQQTLTQLALIRARYFVGSAAGAQLMAQYYEEHARDFQQAEDILKGYTEKCTSDVEGYINLANFYQRHQQTPTASQIYETAINTMATNLPKRVDPETLHARIDILVQLIDVAADVQFALAFAHPPTSPNARQPMLKHFNQARDWLIKSPTRLPEKLRESVDNEITKKLVPQFDDKQNDWFDQREAGLFKQWQQQQQAEQERKQQWLLQAVRMLPKTERQLIESFFKLEADLAQLIEDAPNLTDTEINDFLMPRIEQLINQLHDSELATAMEKLAQILTDVWPLLDGQDRKFLAFALHYLNDDNLLRFAGMSLGLAVEKNLSERCFKPFCQQLQQMPQDKDKMEVCSKSQLTLGNMVWRMAHITDKIDPITVALSEYLSQQPWGIRLLELIGRLRGITDRRNDCAHPDKTPTHDDIEKMLRLVVTDERAFFRYFVGAFV